MGVCADFEMQQGCSTNTRNYGGYLKQIPLGNVVTSDEFLKKLKQFASSQTALIVLLSKINPLGHVFFVYQDIFGPVLR